MQLIVTYNFIVLICIYVYLYVPASCMCTMCIQYTGKPEEDTLSQGDGASEGCECERHKPGSSERAASALNC